MVLIGLAFVLATGGLNSLAVPEPTQATTDCLPEFNAAYLVPASLDDLPRLPNGLPLPMLGRFGPQGGPGTSEPGQLVCMHCSLERLTAVAYEKSPEAITVLDWMSYELYDLIAKVPSGSTAHDVHLMLQQLLNERFQLTVHHVSGHFLDL